MLNLRKPMLRRRLKKCTRAIQWLQSLRVQHPYVYHRTRHLLANALYIGKQTVYHVLQNLDDAAGPEEIVAMDHEIDDLREQITSTKASDKTLRSNLASVNATVSTQHLRDSAKAFEREKHHLLGRLGPLRSGSVKPISVAEKAAVDKAWKKWSENARARKKICLEVWAYVTEMLPDGKTEAELWVSPFNVDELFWDPADGTVGRAWA